MYTKYIPCQFKGHRRTSVNINKYLNYIELRYIMVT